MAGSGRAVRRVRPNSVRLGFLIVFFGGGRGILELGKRGHAVKMAEKHMAQLVR